MKFILINCSISVISTFILSLIVSQPAGAMRLNGSFQFMGNSTYLENNQRCRDEAQANGEIKRDMVTIDANFSIKKDPFDASNSFIKFTWAGSNCVDADKEYSNYQNSGMPWMSKEIPLRSDTMFNPVTWEVEKITFNGELDNMGSSEGFFDFTTGTGLILSRITSTGLVRDATTIFKITNFQSQKVPEPLTMIASGLAIGIGTLCQREYSKKSKK